MSCSRDLIPDVEQEATQGEDEQQHDSYSPRRVQPLVGKLCNSHTNTDLRDTIIAARLNRRLCGGVAKALTTLVDTLTLRSLLQHLSQRWDRHTVTIILKEAPRVSRGDRRKRPSYGIYEYPAAPGLGPSQQRLNLRESLFCRGLRSGE